MRRFVCLMSAVALCLGISGALAQEGGGSKAGGAKQVAIVPIRDEINPGTEATLESRLRRALDNGAEVIILEVNSFGGLLTSCQEACDMLKDVARKHREKVRTVACVKSKAISAAALISLACQEIVMIDGTVIGDAQAIVRTKEGGMEPAPEKAQAMVRGLARSLAQFNDYPEAVVLAMVDPTMEVYKVTYSDGSVAYLTGKELERGGERRPEKKGGGLKSVALSWGRGAPIATKTVASTEQVVEKGKLLVLTSEEAKRFDISTGTVNGVAEAAARYGGVPATTRRYDLNWSERIVQFLNSTMVSGLLMLAGMIAIYVAVKTPGLGVPEVVALVCFGLFFFSKHLVGLAGVGELILFALGFVLLAIEIFLIPGFGVVGVSGIVCIVLALVLSLQKFNLPDPGLPETMAIFTSNILLVLGSIFGSAVCFLVLLRFLPATPFGRRLVLEAAEAVERGFTVGSAEQRTLVGKKGVAMTKLRPAGKAEIDGRTILVVADGEFLDAGTPVVVQEVRGNRVKVVRA